MDKEKIEKTLEKKIEKHPEKVQKNEPKTNIGLILAVLHSNRGVFFSCREISEQIREEYLFILTAPTIRIYLKDIEYLLITRIDRYGSKRQPIKLYALPE